MSKRLWITGGSGFVGRLLTTMSEELRQHFDLELVVALNQSFALEDTSSLDAVISQARPDFVIHLAGISYVPDAERDADHALRVNYMGTHNLLQMLRKQGFRGRFLYVSSADVYGALEPSGLPVHETTPISPRNYYAVSKASSELLCMQSKLRLGFECIIARPFNHIGPGQRPQFLVPSVARQIVRIAAGLQPPEIEIGDTEVTRDFTDAHDVVRGYASLLQHGRDGETYNICSGQERSVHDVISRMLEISHLNKVKLVSSSHKMRQTEQRRVVGSAEKIHSHTGWKPLVEWDTSLSTVLDDWKVRLNE